MPDGLERGPSWRGMAPGLLVAVATACALRAGRGANRAMAWAFVGVVALGGGSIGWWAIGERADAPQRMAAFAAEEQSALGDVERSAARTGATTCVRVNAASCAVCEPMVHFSAPTSHPCGSDVAHVGASRQR